MSAAQTNPTPVAISAAQVNPSLDPLFGVNCSVRGGTTQPIIMTAEMELAMCHRYLKNNRPTRDKRIKAMSFRVLANRWVDNGTARIFDKEGNSLNSHHTHAAMLNAIKINPKITMPVNLVWGVDASAMSTIDTNIGRTGADQLFAAGMNFECGQSAIAEVARYLNSIDTAVASNKEGLSLLPLELDDLELVVWENIDRIEAADKLVASLKKRTPGIRVQILTALYAWGRELPKSIEFIEALATGHNLTQGHPADAGRRTLMPPKQAKKLSQGERLGVCMEAMKLYAVGQTAERIKTPKRFPTLF